MAMPPSNNEPQRNLIRLFVSTVISPHCNKGDNPEAQPAPPAVQRSEAHHSGAVLRFDVTAVKKR
jgi:hypothetical protein